MSLLPIYPYNAAVLREKTRPVSAIDAKLTRLIFDMIETMHVANGIGLAANQVGVGVSLFVMDLSSVEGYSSDTRVIMINPVITDVWGDDIAFEEGCLSVPNVREEIIRPEKLHIRYRDQNFEELEMEVDGMPARVIQHEYDHLQGVFFTDYLKGLRKRLVVPVLKRIIRGEESADYKMASDVEFTK